MKKIKHMDINTLKREINVVKEELEDAKKDANKSLNVFNSAHVFKCIEKLAMLQEEYISRFEKYGVELKRKKKGLNVKDLSYEERVELLRDLFSCTNIVMTAAYGATERPDPDRVELEKNRDIWDTWDDDKKAKGLIVIDTLICTG